MVRKASAVWTGSLKEGKGSITTESGVLANAQYSFSTRFENGKGTNPEELIAAAHAGCFTMALAAQLGNAGITPEGLETRRGDDGKTGSWMDDYQSPSGRCRAHSRRR